MNNDQVKGNAKEVKGEAKESIGKIANDKSLENEGKAEKLAGKVHQKYGDTRKGLKKNH